VLTNSAPAKKPLSEVRILTLLSGEVPPIGWPCWLRSAALTLTRRPNIWRGSAGKGDEELSRALVSARVPRPTTVDGGAEARLAELYHHTTCGAEYFGKKQFAEAAFRAAVRSDPQDSNLHVAFANTLSHQSKTMKCWSRRGKRST
jgi:hypothetical protein